MLGPLAIFQIWAPAGPWRCTEALWRKCLPCSAVHAAPVVCASTAVYTGALVHTDVVVYTGTVVCTGAVV
eukprot:9495166-Pyramimonas_sp.AAC.1